ncbi:MAG TPA: DUF1573 domain-containing protein [Pirellulales bacterium]|nr:DUF1573 domain-containing protein [Pirellulales bacterium]
MTTRLRSTVAFAVALLCFGVVPVSAQEWARKMFKETQYNFGSVARGAKTEHRFKFENLYMEDIHVAGIRASCGCTTPWVTKDTIKTYETSEIVAHFNTDRFSGQRGATLTVTIDRPYAAEVQLRVDGYIRTDVVVDPGSIEFGSLDQGRQAQKKVNVNYAGRGDWKITDVQSSSPYIKATATEKSRQNGQVSYRLNVSLTPDAPAGYLQDQLILVTNDRNYTHVPVAVEGRIVPELVVNPPLVAMGRLQPGQTVRKQIVIQGKEPFRITHVECDNDAFQADLSANTGHEAKLVHLVPILFVAGTKPGKMTGKIRIETDLHGGATTDVRATALVVATEITAAEPARTSRSDR